MTPEEEGFEPDLLVAESYWTSIPNNAIQAVGALDVSATAFVVYCALRTYLHSHTACWPGRDRVCHDFDIPVRTFQRGLATLQDAGMIEVTKNTYLRRGVKITRNVYRFPDVANWHKAGAKLALGSSENWHSGNTKIGTRYKGEEDAVEEETGEALFERSPVPAKRTAFATTVPKGFKLSPEMKAYAISKVPGLDVELEFESFINWHASKGTKHKDWPATWRTWILREAKGRAERPAAYVPTDVRTPLTFRDPYLSYPTAQVVGDPWAGR